MLQGKVAIVTGGANGIGKAVCQRFVEEGVRGVAIVDVDEAAAIELCNELNTKESSSSSSAIAIKTDVSVEEQVKSCVDQVVSHFGRIDILINNAVVFEFGHLLPPNRGSGTGTDREASTEVFNKVMSVSVAGSANFIKYCAREMEKNQPAGTVYKNEQKRGGPSTIDATERGSIINVCSVSSFIAQPEFVPYNCAKSALLAMSRCCAKDFAKLRIRVNAVSPGSIETAGSHNHMDLCGMSLEEGRKVFGDSCDMKRQGAPEEVANACVFLASNQASFITGSNLVVDGGATYY